MNLRFEPDMAIWNLFKVRKEKDVEMKKENIRLMRPKVIQNKTNTEMLLFAILQLAKMLEVETPVIDFIPFVYKRLRLVYLTLFRNAIRDCSLFTAGGRGGRSVIFQPTKALRQMKNVPLPESACIQKFPPPPPFRSVPLAKNFTPPPPEHPHERQKAVVTFVSKLRRRVYRSLSP